MGTRPDDMPTEGLLARVRERLTYANVMSTIAAFLGLGGAAYAVTELPKDSVGPDQLKRGAVDSRAVKDGSLRAADLGQGSVGPRQLKSGAVGAGAIAAGAVGTTQLADGSVEPQNLGFAALAAGDVGVHGSNNANDQVLTKDFTTVGTTTVKTLKTTTFLSLGSLELTSSQQGPAVVSYRILVDGVVQPGVFEQTVDSGATLTAPVTLVSVNVPAGDHTVELQAQVQSGVATVNVDSLGVISAFNN
jgi:hypothetical protein